MSLPLKHRNKGTLKTEPPSDGEPVQNKQMRYQSVLAGVVDHPALLHDVAALPLCVFDRLHHPHQWDVVTGGGTAGTQVQHRI